MEIRMIGPEDRAVIEKSLEQDMYHKDTPADFFYDTTAMTNVYELDNKPVMYVRATKALRIDIQFVDNKDFKNNKRALEQGFDSFVENVKKAGFTELVFDSTSPLLIAFCKRYFGFVEAKGELRKYI